MRTEETIRSRLAAVEAELDDLDTAASDTAVQHPMEAYQQALRWVLREREQDEKPPLGSRWRQQKTVTGQEVGRTKLERDGIIDAVVLACKTRTKSTVIELSDESGEYVLIRKDLDRGVEQAAEWEPPAELEK